MQYYLLNRCIFLNLTEADVIIDKCNPSPCGTNAICRDGQCSCVVEHQGDPYVGCRPECVLSTDCPRDKACLRNKCVNPCQGTCSSNAICEVINHVPMCSCPQGMTGNAFYNCEPIRGKFGYKLRKYFLNPSTPHTKSSFFFFSACCNKSVSSIPLWS